VAAGHPDAPACHVSWFEADAFARAHGARLPTEAEWEKAATWNQEPTDHGPTHPRPALTAPDPTDTATGALEGTGQVWEWTASAFGGYPGFVAHPYPQYSEVFFGGEYRVLRGGSWATHPRVATPTFRNWDLPQRRQIFAGVRLAKEA
jgi:iron(II)-dependent oxidoreductase